MNNNYRNLPIREDVKYKFRAVLLESYPMLLSVPEQDLLEYKESTDLLGMEMFAIMQPSVCTEQVLVAVMRISSKYSSELAKIAGMNTESWRTFADQLKKDGFGEPSVLLTDMGVNIEVRVLGTNPVSSSPKIEKEMEISNQEISNPHTLTPDENVRKEFCLFALAGLCGGQGYLHAMKAASAVEIGNKAYEEFVRTKKP